MTEMEEIFIELWNLLDLPPEEQEEKAEEIKKRFHLDEVKTF